MADIHTPLNRFRKPNTSSNPLHERWGDVSISAPTDGSWNQRRTKHSPSSHIIHHSEDDDDIVPLTGPHPSRRNNNSLTLNMNTLNPRRLSVRLKSRPSNTTTPAAAAAAAAAAAGAGGAGGAGEASPEQKHADRRLSRTEFMYKPVRQDYPSIVAETTASQSRPGPRYQYIPASPGRYGEEFSTSASASPVLRGGGFGDNVSAQYAYEYDCGYGYRLCSSETGGRRVGLFSPRREYSSGSVAERSRSSRAARRLTTVMVPDAEDIYG